MSTRVGVFIDVGNQFYCIGKKWPGRKLDYSKYLEKAESFGKVVRSFAYGTQVDDAAVRFITALCRLGYEPKYQQVERNIWYSWNVGLAMDIVRLVTHDKVDTVVIGNSDKSMTHVVAWAKERGVRVILVGCGINKDLKTICDQWFEIEECMLEGLSKPELEDIIEEEDGTINGDPEIETATTAE